MYGYHATVCVVILAVLTTDQVKGTRYDGHQLLRVHPTTSRQVEFLRTLHDNGNLQLDFWTFPVLDHDVDIRVPPRSRSYVKQLIKNAGLSASVAIDDIQSSIDKEFEDMANARMSRTGHATYNFLCDAFGINCPEDETGGGPTTPSGEIVGIFARHIEIDNWLTAMASEFGQLATVESIGTSYEGRKMNIIKIGKTSPNVKPVIWVEAGIHAREWISPAVAVWTIDKMLRNYGTDDDVTFMLDTFDWYFLPSANPDGYEYTFTDDRLWRKTRSPQDQGCMGVDPNRNFDIEFGGAGTSSNPCSNTYPGKYAFSEPETANIQTSIMNVRDRVVVFLSFHAYSQLMLTPYGYTSNKPSDYQEMLRVADASMAALKAVHGKTFQVGTPPEILYAVSGGTYDWAKAKAGVKYSYTYELRPATASSAQSGFIIGEEQIVPSGEEVWASLVTIAREVQL
ncbi:carboxypeptidase B-like [Ylistrum balloti]|uniref:carboxypeptidase B-like n=1 Tax=Ylistrum balloti TaxID=509963 RepID=UPI002905C34E|nr:carboxypeptidase B-like [Ylistrum balloti]